ncbi:MAG: right-handed parallel beta-helix repeat-containing protein [Pirellulales bacterium]
MCTLRAAVWHCGWFCLLLAAPAAAAEFHVSPSGSAAGAGTAAEPWDLATALSPPSVVRPGDTIWLHEGTYQGGYTSRLAGRPDAPIVVRGASGERAIIDAQPRDDRDNALFFLGGADTIYRDFEVTCLHPLRETKIAGSWPEDIHRGNIDVRGDRIKVVNLVVHDLGSGFGLWSEGEGGEVSGCLIYNNGWQGPDRGHGHAIYAQNARGVKRIADNVVFHQFGYGIHAYGSEKASLKGFEIDGNFAFENGALAKGDGGQGIMVGGGCPVAQTSVRDNVVLNHGMRLGYPWGPPSNEDIVCTGNYCEGSLVLRDFRQATVSRNTVVAHSNVAILEGAGDLLLSGLKWDHNDYYLTDGRWGDCAAVENGKSRGMSFDDWRSQMDVDGESTFTKGAPDKLRVFVRPNAYQPGRANIAVINPQLLPKVEVDLAGVLEQGQKFRVVSVKDFYGPTLAEGIYSGELVSLPMQPITPPPPVGMPNAELPVTEPGFAAFVVLPD